MANAIRQRILGDRRLLGCASALGVIYALFTVLGRELKAYSELQSSFWALAGQFVLFAALYTLAAALVFSLFKAQNGRAAKKETLFDRITGNGFVVFVLLLVCWIPVWLAFWPGHFSADSLTQFDTYYNETPYAHHPLLHTALLGACMTTGINLHPEGYATWGLAIYCGVQMVLLAACIAYGCWWLRRRGAPVWARLTVTLLFAIGPFYAPWAFCAQKDVLFAALVLVFCLQVVDLWRFGVKPVRVILFVIIAVLMMLLRNNGVYALALAIPFGIWWAQKGKRVKTAVLLILCAAMYLAVNEGAIYLMEAEKGSRVEMLSVPLQQMARTLREDPDAIELDEDGVLETLYGDTQPAEIYHSQISDPVKWAVDYDALDESIPALLALWAKMLPSHLDTYAEAFLIQNLPYFMPYSDMLYNFDMTVHQSEWFPIEQHSYLPRLREVYLQYDQTLSFMGIPGTRLLSDTAFFVWLCLAGFLYAIYSRQYGCMTAFAFLIGIWITCLLGPVALMRYMLGLFYAVPVLLTYLLVPGRQA